MFTPVHTTLGALLLFSGAFGLLIHNGRIFGISSILRSCLLHPKDFLSNRRGIDDDENLLILAGLVTGPVFVKVFVPSLLPSYPETVEYVATGSSASPWISAALTVGLGFLTGWGTKNDHGCTSGHMLCGISRLSPRSMIATAIFFTTGLITANFAPILTGHKLIPACDDGRPCYYPVFPTVFELSVMTTICMAALFVTFVLGLKAVPRSPISRRLFAYLAGVHFSLGLLFSGMAEPAKVIRFFAFISSSADFDPSLALIVLFAIGPSLYCYLTMKPGEPDAEGTLRAPTLANSWRLPKLSVGDIDWRFVLGAIIFGISWGSSGVCPGPAVLRSVLQPVWGVLWMSGYFLGGIV